MFGVFRCVLLLVVLFVYIFDISVYLCFKCLYAVFSPKYSEPRIARDYYALIKIYITYNKYNKNIFHKNKTKDISKSSKGKTLTEVP